MRRKISLSQQIIFWQTLEHLMQASIPLYQALAITQEVVEGRQLKNLLSQIQSDLTAGLTLSQSLARYDTLDGRAHMQMIELGEKTGNYARAFALITQQLTWRRSWQQLIQHSLRYPLFLMILLGILFSLIILLVLPGLVEQLAILGIKDLPLATQILITAGQYPLQILLSCLVLIFLMLGWRTYRHRRGLKPWRYMLPRLGDMLYGLQMMQFFHALGVMLSARVDILASLYHASQVPSCAWLRSMLQEKEQFLVAGAPLSLALRDMLPSKSPTASLIIVGETTGTLGELLTTSCETEQAQLQLKLTSWLDLLQPLLVLVMGLIMIWVVLAVLLPLYESVGNFHG